MLNAESVGWHGQVLLPVVVKERHGQEYLPAPPKNQATDGFASGGTITSSGFDFFLRLSAFFVASAFFG